MFQIHVVGSHYEFFGENRKSAKAAEKGRNSAQAAEKGRNSAQAAEKGRNSAQAAEKGRISAQADSALCFPFRNLQNTFYINNFSKKWLPIEIFIYVENLIPYK